MKSVFCQLRVKNHECLCCIHARYTPKYLTIKAQPAFSIDSCGKCRHYIKMIDEAELKENIPRGLEDILTLNLDLVAKKCRFRKRLRSFGVRAQSQLQR